jgi:Ca2+-binding EF-hand superfamily protein
MVGRRWLAIVSVWACAVFAKDATVSGGGGSGGGQDGESWTRGQDLLSKHVDEFLPKIDKNGDKQMSLGEIYIHISSAMRQRHEGFNDAMMEGFREADKDRSKSLTQEEYLAWELQVAEESDFGWAVTGDAHQRTIDKLASSIFKLLDHDNSGKLDAGEHARRTGIDADIMQMLHVADKNGDQKLSREELLAAAGKIPAHLEFFLAHEEL